MDYVAVTDDMTFTIEQITKMINDDMIDRLVAYRNLVHKTRKDIADAMGISVEKVERMESKEEITPLAYLQSYADSIGVELRFEVGADKRIAKRRPLPLGITDFRTLSSKFSYIDKTLLIKTILEQEMSITLFMRPRRFGKTVNMDMLRVFFEKTDEDTSVYFKNKKIWRCGAYYQKHQGQYPVIFLTFKDVKYATWEDNITCLRFILATEFNRHPELFESDRCDEFERRYFSKVAYGEVEEIELAQSLLFLSRMLTKHHGKKTFIMIDEYDTPIQQGYMGGYYDQAVTFMRSFLSAGLKDNQYLAYGFLTGILRVAKESIFSSLNNVKVNSVLDDQYSEFFGFTPEEVQQLVVYYGVPEKYEEICEWYDGYRFGQTDIFNPWSVMEYLYHQCKPQAYWVSTAKNDVIGEILADVSNEIRTELHKLLQGETVYTQVDTSVIYPEVHSDSATIYSFLLVSGYLKFINKRLHNGEYVCEVSIPNKELFTVFRKEILSKMKHVIPPSTVMKIHEALYKNDAEGLQRELHKLLLQTVSYNDAASENFYHGFVLGLCAMLDNCYYVTSNRESGEGRFDIQLMPRQQGLPGILMELKSAKSMTKGLKELAQKALKQIESKQYDVDMKMQGVHEIYKYGVAFYGKAVEVVTKIEMDACFHKGFRQKL